MTAISNRQPEVNVNYTCPACKGTGSNSKGHRCRPCTHTGRITKHFTSAYVARLFYVQQFDQGNEPRILRSEPMSSTSTATETATKSPVKRSKKVTAKKTPVKKAKSSPKKVTKKKTPVKKASNDLSGTLLTTLKCLKSERELSHAQIAKATGKEKGNRLRDLESMGFVKKLDLEEVRGFSYQITTAGKKALS